MHNFWVGQVQLLLLWLWPLLRLCCWHPHQVNLCQKIKRGSKIQNWIVKHWRFYVQGGARWGRRRWGWKHDSKEGRSHFQWHVHSSIIVIYMYTWTPLHMDTYTHEHLYTPPSASYTVKSYKDTPENPHNRQIKNHSISPSPSNVFHRCFCFNVFFLSANSLKVTNETHTEIATVLHMISTNIADLLKIGGSKDVPTARGDNTDGGDRGAQLHQCCRWLQSENHWAGAALYLKGGNWQTN